MRRTPLLALVLAAVGCAHGPKHIAVDGAVLGRVVVYRNGVAFYERTAKVVDGQVTVRVPRDRVDDFLKSLTVVDPATRKPLAVSIPRQEADDGSYLTMILETPDRRQADVLLTYVTESPAWKPSYRVVVGSDGKVMLEGWAIVDNVSGEDWRNVLVGVGASSALSFRYDLWSVRRIDRDLLEGEQRFAVAPPTGVSPYAESAATEELASLDATEVRGVAFSGSTSLENNYVIEGINTTGVTFNGDTTGMTNSPPSSSSSPAPSIGSLRGEVLDKQTGEKLAGVTVVATMKGSKDTLTAITNEHGTFVMDGLKPGTYTVTYYYGDASYERAGINVAANKSTPVYQKIDSSRVGAEVIAIKGTAPTIDQTSTASGITIDRDYMRTVPVPGRTFENALGSAAGVQSDGRNYTPPSPIKQGDAKLAGIADKIVKSKKDVVIEAHGLHGAEVAKRAEAVKNKLVDDGVPASRIRIVPKLGSHEHRIRVYAVAPAKPDGAAAPPPTATTRGDTPDTPVGESHFIADRPMNVRAGTSAMVAMVHTETAGGVVYLYDPISERGHDQFAFKAVRLDNPTDDTLEPGPVTVYGEGRFIGEGITEPVPPKASVVVPFAADRQVLIEKDDHDANRIAKLVTLQRGIVTAEVQHRRETRFKVTSRLTTPAKVYLRHRLESGWTLVDSPPRHMKVGDSHLFEVDLAPGETKRVAISEATPVTRTLDLASPEALGLMQLYIEEPEINAELKTQLSALLATHRASADLVDKIATLRDQLAEYRSRAGELHAQLVTLKAVRTSGELISALKTKLADTNDRMQKATIAIVDAQEQIMLARVKFQNQLADLKLTDVTAKK